MSGMHEQLVPEDVSDAPQLASGIPDLAVQVADFEARNSHHRIVVDNSKRRSQGFYSSWPVNMRWFDIQPDLAMLDPKRHVSLHFSKMPRKLPQRSATRIWAKIILTAR